MQTKRVVNRAHDCGRSFAEQRADAVDGHGANLFSLRFGVDAQSGGPGRQEHLEGMDALDVGSDRDDGEHTTSELSRSLVGVIV